MPRRPAHAHGATATAGTRRASFADTLHRNPTALQGQRDALYDLRETPERVGHLVVASCARRLVQDAPRPANRDEADAMPVQEPCDLLCHGIPRMAQPCTLRGIEWSTRRGLSYRRGGTRRLGTVYCLNTWRHGVREPATTCCRSDIRVAGHGNHLLGEQEGQAMRREASLVQLPSEIIHISLPHPRPQFLLPSRAHRSKQKCSTPS
jgi:hypothetical protein